MQFPVCPDTSKGLFKQLTKHVQMFILIELDDVYARAPIVNIYAHKFAPCFTEKPRLVAPHGLTSTNDLIVRPVDEPAESKQ